MRACPAPDMPDHSGEETPTAEQIDERAKRLKAILFIILAFACFSGLDATAKWLSPRIGVIETTWARYLSSFLIVSVFLNPWSRPGLMRTSRPMLQAIRSAALLISTVLNFVALQYLQLAETMTILFLQPLLVALISGPLLGEWAGPRRLAAIGVGFIGVILIMRPGAGGIHWAAIFSFLGVGAYAAYSMITRVLAAHDSSETTMFYSAIAGVVVLTPIIPFVWRPPADGLTLALMLLIGFWGALGHWLLILAHRHASAATLSPFLYTQIVWMIGLGYVIVGDVPDLWTLAGASIVIISGIYLFHRERVRRVID